MHKRCVPFSNYQSESMKPIRYFFLGLTLLGIFLLAAGAAGSHGHFGFRPHMTEDWIIFGTPFIGLTGFLFTWAMRGNVNKQSVKASVRNSMDFFKLLESLDKAIGMMIEIKVGHSREFGTPDAFTERLRVSKDNIQKFNFAELKNLSAWFEPTSVWDEFVGEEGIAVGTEVFELTEKLKSNN
jgi:hypothetical protein